MYRVLSGSAHGYQLATLAVANLDPVEEGGGRPDTGLAHMTGRGDFPVVASTFFPHPSGRPFVLGHSGHSATISARGMLCGEQPFFGRKVCPFSSCG